MSEQQVPTSAIRRRVERLVGKWEIPVPEGHARRRRGFVHCFLRAKDTGTVAKALCAEFGTEPEFVHKGHTVPCLVWRSARPVDGWQIVLWLPFGEDFCVLST